MNFRRLKSYGTTDECGRREIENYISRADPQTSEMMRLRFIVGLKYFQVAMTLGGGMSADCVKKRIYRYIKNHR